MYTIMSSTCIRKGEISPTWVGDISARLLNAVIRKMSNDVLINWWLRDVTFFRIICLYLKWWLIWKTKFKKYKTVPLYVHIIFTRLNFLITIANSYITVYVNFKKKSLSTFHGKTLFYTGLIDSYKGKTKRK